MLTHKKTHPDGQTVEEARSDGSQVIFSHRELSLIISLLQVSQVKGVINKRAEGRRLLASLCYSIYNR